MLSLSAPQARGREPAGGRGAGGALGAGAGRRREGAPPARVRCGGRRGADRRHAPGAAPGAAPRGAASPGSATLRRRLALMLHKGPAVHAVVMR